MDDQPYVIDAFCLRDFLRGEIGYEEMTGGRTDVVYSDYHPTIEDFLCAFKNMAAKGFSRREFGDEWFCRIFFDAVAELGLVSCTEGYGGRFVLYDYEDDVFNLIWNWSNDLDSGTNEGNKDDLVEFDEMIRTLKVCMANLKAYPEDKRYTTLMKRNSVLNVGAPMKIDYATPPIRAFYKKFVNDLCRVHDAVGLRSKGVSCLFGNVCFKKNIYNALKYFQELYLQGHDPRVAKIMGDIYSGIFGSIVDHDKAFNYYVMSGMDGCADGLLRVADMFYEGMGTIRNQTLAYTMVKGIYEQSLDEFCAGETDGIFAETAFRLGDILDSGIDGKRNALEAFKYMNIAGFAATINAGERDDIWAGKNSALSEAVSGVYERLAGEVGADKNAKTVISELPNLLLSMMTDGYSVHVDIKKTKSDYKLITNRNKKDNEQYVKRVLIDFPLLEFCTLTSLVTESCPKNSEILVADGSSSFDSDEIVYDKKTKTCIFKFRGRTVAKIRSAMFLAKLRS